MKTNNNGKTFIHIDKLEDGRLVMDAANIDTEDTVYLLTEFIYFIANAKDIPLEHFVDIIKNAVLYKKQLEEEKGNHSEGN
ncbi:hypothetical protein [Brachyspira pilosicoli]|uniref:hypothetical protein n=1 Tax=Brachyspira pilosicoli TaxID=52584 RepID=UPI0030065C93